MRSKKPRQSEDRASRFQWGEGELEFHSIPVSSTTKAVAQRVLLSGVELSNTVAQVCAGTRVSCAVAFWGKGANKLIGASRDRELRVICNLKMGGTNPSAIDALMNAGVATKQCDNLHAKVYIGDREAVITSANASINGLGLEGTEIAGWIETGAIVPASAALPWFEKLWEQSRTIEPVDLERARIAFKTRQMGAPTLPSFEDFDVTSEYLPLVSWSFFPKDFITDASVVGRDLGVFNKEIKRRIENGIDINCDEDVNILTSGTWVLKWAMTDKRRPRQPTKVQWCCTSGRYVKGAGVYQSEEGQVDVMLEAEDPPPIPFDPREPRFLRAFCDVLERPQYSKLSEIEYKGSFFATCQELMRPFWKDVKTCYLQIA